MKLKVTELELTQRYPKSLQICAADGNQVDVDSVKILRIVSHYKSALVYVVAAGHPDNPSHVIKINANKRWDPRREFDGLAYALEVFNGMPSFGGYRLSAINPVGYGYTPTFLVTRFQPGQSCRPVFDRAILGLGSSEKIEQAKAIARVSAHWLSEFRSNRTRVDPAHNPQECLLGCQRYADRIRHFLGVTRPVQTVISFVANYMEGISDVDRASMEQTHPLHGDFVPQNFHVDAERAFSVLDIGGFQNAPRDIDFASFRIRMEQYCLRGPLARVRAQQVWEAFLQDYLDRNGSSSFSLFCYLHHLLARLASIKDMSQQTVRQSMKTRIKNWLWIRSRLQWMRGLTGDVNSDADYMRRKL